MKKQSKRHWFMLMGLLTTTSCGPSEKSATEQRIVDVYESWSAEVRPASCSRYYGFPHCPDLDRYKTEIDQHCATLTPTTANDLSEMMHQGWQIQSQSNHEAEADVKMQDGLVLDTTCKGQRYIMTRTCVTRLDWLGRETPDPKCEVQHEALQASPSHYQPEVPQQEEEFPKKATGDTIRINNGNLFLSDENGQLTQLTEDGGNSDAVLSPDEKVIAYVHTGRIDDNSDSEDVAEIHEYRLHPEGSDASNVVIIGPKDEMGNVYSVGQPQFSIDGKYLYAVANTNATSGTIYRFDLSESTWKSLIDGNSVDVMRSGTFKGYLLISRHRYHSEGGSYDETFLVTPTGTVVYAIPGSRIDSNDDNDIQAKNAVEHWKSNNG